MATDGESLYAMMRTGPVASRLPSKAGVMFAGVKRRRATQRVRYVVRITQLFKLIYDHCSNLYLLFFISSDGHTNLGFRHDVLHGLLMSCPQVLVVPVQEPAINLLAWHPIHDTHGECSTCGRTRDQHLGVCPRQHCMLLAQRVALEVPVTT